MSGKVSIFARGKVQGIILLVLVIAIGATIAAASYTETDKYCGSCHSMKPLADTWVNGNHAETDCAECHLKPGFTGWFENRMAIARMRGVEKKGGATSFAQIPIEDQFCLRCHASAASSKGTDQIAAPHTIHVGGMGISCNECHEGQVHGIDGAMPAGISHDKCNTCHGEWFAQGTADCAKCHVKVDIVKTEKLNIPHETHSFLSCDACHAEYVTGSAGVLGHSSCVQCHEEWFSATAPSCGSCHTNLEFTETEQYIIPHGSHTGFGCETCHSDQVLPAGDGLSHASCESCHEAWFEEECTKCHKW
jgi:nitrate/TMAO reductase-like tetraheme cytochrome c subunit